MAGQKIDNTQALCDVVASQEKKDALLSEILRISRAKSILEASSKAVQEDVKGTAKAFGFSVAYLNSLIGDYSSGELEAIIRERTAYVDVLQELNEVRNDSSEC